MTNQEFSDTFSVLYNNIASNQAPGLDEYEKSVFLTKAQNEIVLSYFDPLKNKPQEGFDGNEKRQIDFSMLMKLNTGTEYTGSNALKISYADNAKLFVLPTDILLIINEKIEVLNNNKTKNLIVTPVTYKIFNTLMTKPFKRPIKNQAWRLNNSTFETEGNTTTQAVVEIIPGIGDTISNYVVRYIKRPQPIVLTTLEGDLKVGGVQDETPCELDPIIHDEILQRAVELAKIAYQGDVATTLQGGSLSSTDKGYAQVQQQSR